MDPDKGHINNNHPPKKMFMIVSFVFKKHIHHFIIKPSKLCNPKNQLTMVWGGRGVSVNVKGETLSIQSYLLKINYVFNLYLQLCKGDTCLGGGGGSILFISSVCKFIKPLPHWIRACASIFDLICIVKNSIFKL